MRYGGRLRGRPVRQRQLALHRRATCYASNGENDTTFGSAFSMPNLRAGLAGFGGSGCLDAVERSAADGDHPSRHRQLPLLQHLRHLGDHDARFAARQHARTWSPTSPRRTGRGSKPSREVLDFVVSGELFACRPARRPRHRRPAPHATTGRPIIRRCRTPDRATCRRRSTTRTWTRSSNAVFAEVSVPLMNSDSFGTLDFTGALRYENTGGAGLRPPIRSSACCTARPGTCVKVRGTWSTSFLAPSLYQRYRQNVVFTNAVNDGLTPQNDNLSRVPTQVTGNPGARSADLGELQPRLHGAGPGTTGASTSTTGISPSTTRSRWRTPWNWRPTSTPRSIRPRSSAAPAAGTVIYNGVNVGADRRPQRRLHQQCLAGVRGLRLRDQQHVRLGALRRSCATRCWPPTRARTRSTAATSRRAATRALPVVRSRCRGARR